ncbi:ABC transporter permease [Lacticaseibacillus suihuaensis]
MANKFKSVGLVLALNLRRDWLKIVFWLLGLGGLMTAAAAKFDGLYSTQKAMSSIAETLSTPAMVSMFGPFTPKPPYTVAVIYGAMMMVFMGLFAAMMNVYFAVHATRVEEDAGRTEFILAHAVGRQSPLAAAILELAAINLVAGVLEALGLQAANMTGGSAAGNWLFGLGLAAFGFMFGCFSLLIAQVASSGRSATILSYVLLGGLYVVRMGTDVQNPDLSWWTIFGWIEKLNLYTHNTWWPLLLMLGLSAVLLVVAVALSTARDTGAGLIQPRAGRARASRFLAGPLTLLARLERTSTLIWLVSLFILGASYGSIFGTVGDLVKTNPAIGQLMGTGALHAAGRTMVLTFANKLSIIFAVVATIPAVITLLKLNGDERGGYLELVHAKPVSRLRLYVSFLVHAVLAGSAALVLGILGMAVAGSASLTTTPISIARYLRAFVGYWPAVLVTLGVVLVVIAVLPRLQAWVWAIPIYGVLSLYLGNMIGLPEWATKITPYGWVNHVPAAAIDWGSFAWMTALGLALMVAGYVGYKRRDLLTN